jgi:hypothetical protein
VATLRILACWSANRKLASGRLVANSDNSRLYGNLPEASPIQLSE